jgi:hypothetical protein
MDLIQISNLTSKTIGSKRTIRYTQSICPDCNMILDAEVFEREGKVFMTKTCVQVTVNVKNYTSVLMKCTRNLVHIGWMERVQKLQM